MAWFLCNIYSMYEARRQKGGFFIYSNSNAAFHRDPSQLYKKGLHLKKQKCYIFLFWSHQVFWRNDSLKCTRLPSCKTAVFQKHCRVYTGSLSCAKPKKTRPQIFSGATVIDIIVRFIKFVFIWKKITIKKPNTNRIIA
jgi:hypothetical protein